MKKVYWTELAIIDTTNRFLIELEEGHSPFQVAVTSLMNLTQNNKDIIQELVFEEVKKELGTGKFFLIPSKIQVELDAYREAQMKHPENFPMDGDRSPGGFGSFREDS